MRAVRSSSMRGSMTCSCHLILPYLFPELSAFATVADLVTHLCTSDTRYRVALPTKLLYKNPPPMYIALYFIVTRLPDSLSDVGDLLLALEPTELTVDLLKKHLLEAETRIVTVGASCGTPRTPFFEECSPSPLVPSVASAAAADYLCAEEVGVASAPSRMRRSGRGKGGRGSGGGSGGGGGGGGGGGDGGGGGGGGGGGDCGGGGSGGGSGGFGGGGGGGSGSGGGGSGGGSGSGGGGSGGGRGGASRRSGSGVGQRQHQQRQRETPSPQELRDWLAQRRASGGSTRCQYIIRIGDRAGQTCGKVGHTQSCCFSRLDDAFRVEFPNATELPHWAELLRPGVDIFALDYDAILAAMYALIVSAEGDYYLCMPPDPGIEAAALSASESALSVLARSSTILLCLAVSSGFTFPHSLRTWSLPPLPPSPVPPTLACPCVERQRAAPQSSFPSTTAPLQTLHMDVWGPARVRKQGRERYFLLVVDDYSRYTTVFPLRSKDDVTEVLIDWIRAARLQLQLRC
ncbi:unnamed protein product [Closterium sp. NIES-64]|nr:unnamed protein product [Closterium sp. NIES-64]